MPCTAKVTPLNPDKMGTLEPVRAVFDFRANVLYFETEIQAELPLLGTTDIQKPPQAYNLGQDVTLMSTLMTLYVNAVNSEGKFQILPEDIEITPPPIPPTPPEQ